jgi:hypothetical protein|tara:strand:+ start:346 stop:1020 length:675 start_codon:yes stop_codon:yes gene_type:complete
MKMEIKWKELTDKDFLYPMHNGKLAIITRGNYKSSPDEKIESIAALPIWDKILETDPRIVVTTGDDCCSVPTLGLHARTYQYGPSGLMFMSGGNKEIEQTILDNQNADKEALEEITKKLENSNVELLIMPHCDGRNVDQRGKPKSLLAGLEHGSLWVPHCKVGRYSKGIVVGGYSQGSSHITQRVHRLGEGIPLDSYVGAWAEIQKMVIPSDKDRVNQIFHKNY